METNIDWNDIHHCLDWQLFYSKMLLGDIVVSRLQLPPVIPAQEITAARPTHLDVFVHVLYVE